MSKTVKKSVSVLTTVTTTLWMSGVIMLAPMAASAALVDGDLIRNPNAEGMAQFDIYIVKFVGTKQFKRLIISPHVFESYEHFDKNGNGSPWDDVQLVDQATMDSCTTSDLVREDGGTKVYRLVADGDTGTKEWLNMTAEEFVAAGYDWDAIYVVNNTDVSAYTTGTDVPPDEEPIVSDGTLTVTLAADTPAAGVAVQNAARLPFTKVNLSAVGGDVIIDTMTVQRTGLGQDAAFTSVDIIDAETNLPINATSKTFNSLHEASVTEDVTIESGTTKSFVLAANMPSSLSSYSGETPSLSLSGVTVKGDATVNASLPITGNTMTINHTITIGTATVQRGAYTNATSTSIQVGKQDYTFFSFQIQAGSAEKVEFSQVKIYQEGSASFGTDLVNVELLQDGTKIADATYLTSKYALFNFDKITLDKGQTAQFQVKADVEDGSARTIDLGIYKATDMLVKGLTYGYNITPTYSSTGSSSQNPVMSDNLFTISNGTLNVTRSNTVAAGNVSVNNDQYLGAFEFDCKGEEIDISELVLTIVSSGGTGQIEDALMGLELVRADTGETVAGPTDITNNLLTVTWTDTFTIPVGKTIYKVRGDLQTNGGWASDDTIYVTFNPSAMTCTGGTTGNTITPTPNTTLQGNTQTVKAADLKVTRNTLPASQYIIVNQNDVVLSSWSFDATDSGEDIRVTSLLWASRGQASTNTNALTTFVDENKNGVWDEGTDTALSPVNDAIADGDADATSTFAFSSPLVITKGTTKHVCLRGDKDTVSSNDTENWGLTDTGGASIIAYGASTGNSVTESLTADDGPTFTSTAKGTLTIETQGNPTSGLVVGGSTGNVFTNIRLTAKYEDLDVDELVVYVLDGGHTFDAGDGEYRDVTNVAIYDGTTKLKESSIGSTGYHTFTFSKGDLIIPVGSTNAKKLTIKADMGTIDPDNDNSPATANADIKIGIGGIDGIKTTGRQSNSTLTTTTYEIYRSSTSSVMVLKGSVPTITLPTASNSLGAATSLTNGSIPVYAFKVTADSAGEVLLARFTFVLATSGSSMTVSSLRVDDQYGNQISAGSTLNDYDGSKENWYTTAFDNPDVSVGDAMEAISIPAGESRTFKLYATIGGAVAGENFTTFLVGDVASTTTDDECNVTNFAISTNSTGWLTPTGANLASGAHANFVWSDNWKQASIYGSDGADNATTLAQWYNGYLVSGLNKKVSTTPYVIAY